MVDSPYIAPALDRTVGLRRQVTFQAMRVFSGWGFREIEIPLIDYFDSLKRGLGEDQIERSFRFVDRGGNVMMLRTDVTPAIAKVVAYQMRGGPVPLRVSYANKVVRIERSLDRSNFESYQLGIELIGQPGLVGDLEIFLVALELLERLGLKDYQFNVTDHGIARHLLAATGAPSRIRDDVRDAIVARDADEVRRILEDLGIRERYVEAIAALASLEGGLHQLTSIQALLPEDRRLIMRLDAMRKLFDVLSELGYQNHIRLDMGELGGASYYTGMSFNIVSEGVGRSLGRGGRYDDLIGLFGRASTAVGFSLSSGALVELLHPRTAAGVDEGSFADNVGVPEAEPAAALAQVLERRRFNKPVRVHVDKGE